MQPYIACNYIIKAISTVTINEMNNYWTKTSSGLYIKNINVGINTANPTQTLDVSGNINFTGELLNNGIPFLSVDTLNNQVDISGNLNISGNLTRNGNPLVDAIPIGTILAQSSNIIPTSWLFCDGSAISRINYPDLFDTIGVTYGSGDGSTTFNLPDLRGKDIIGAVPADDNNANNNYIVGSTGGESNHIITLDELPSHSHNIYSTNSLMGGEYNGSGVYDILTGDRGGSYNTLTTDGNLFIESTGGNHPINLIQPYVACNYIIKAIPTVSLLNQPFNFWTKTDTGLNYNGSDVNININSPSSTVEIGGTTLLHTIKKNIVAGSYTSGEFQITEQNQSKIIDITVNSIFTIDLDLSTDDFVVSFGLLNNIHIGLTGEIYIFERSNNRNIIFDNTFLFSGSKPLVLPGGSLNNPTMSKLSYTVIRTNIIACKFENFM
jgi:microcystin-dependent protein